MTAQSLLVTGTDTGVGKTRVASALLRAGASAGLAVIGMKPVAAGIEPGAAMNADVAELIAASNVGADAGTVNPYSFAEPIAPHVAAARCGRSIDVDVIAACHRRLAGLADLVVVEGAGGAMVPLGPRDDVLDIAARLAVPVVLVVAVRLGAINHALLSALAIRARGLALAGWIANRTDVAMLEPDATVAAIAERLGRAPAADLAFGARAVDERVLARLGIGRR